VTYFRALSKHLCVRTEDKNEPLQSECPVTLPISEPGIPTSPETFIVLYNFRFDTKTNAVDKAFFLLDYLGWEVRDEIVCTRLNTLSHAVHILHVKLYFV
jgi:hypothetical protein